MLYLSLCLNLAILIPLLWAMAADAPGMAAAFGPDTDARRILACVYGAIALADADALALLATGRGDVAVALAIPLLVLQILYKVATVPVAGLASPVVLTNLVVVAVHAVTLARLWRY